MYIKKIVDFDNTNTPNKLSKSLVKVQKMTTSLMDFKFYPFVYIFIFILCSSSVCNANQPGTKKKTKEN